MNEITVRREDLSQLEIVASKYSEGRKLLVNSSCLERDKLGSKRQ